ncbi:MAG TPA: hypothetical protein EYG21_03770 [Nitrospinaceae bacterium]|nr:hypothetical protein [Nitrospinaceae bacterium]
MKQIKVEPDYDSISDEDLIGLVAWCEKWKLAEVYDTAFKQAHMDTLHDFPAWIISSNPKLPLPVRMELQRAAKINYESGRMWSLQLAHGLLEVWRLVLRHSVYAIFAFLIAYFIIR